MPADEESRRRVGERVYQERSRRGWSVETAMEYGGIGHMTWRRIERGDTVHAKSYAAVDQAFGWRAGHTHAVIDAGADLLSTTPGTGQTDDDASGMETSIRLNEAIRTMQSLPLGELKALHAMATDHLAERERRIDAIHGIIQERMRGASPEGEFLAPDVVAGMSDEKIRRYTQILYDYHRYHRRMSELATELYDHENEPDLDIGDLDHLYRQVSDVDQQIETIIEAISDMQMEQEE